MMMNGHRLRILQKFINNPDSFDSVDILELLLFVTNSRKNTREIARSVLSKYKYLCSIESASVEDLKEIDGFGDFSAVFLKALFKLCSLIGKERIENKPLCIQSLVDYIRLVTRSKCNEVLFIAMIDIRNKIKSIEVVAQGDSTCVDVNIKTLIRVILEKDPKSIIILHNHPSGDVTPSSNDIQNTKNIKRILHTFNIDVLDSIIVGNLNHYSLLEAKLI